MEQLQLLLPLYVCKVLNWVLGFVLVYIDPCTLAGFSCKMKQNHSVFQHAQVYAIETLLGVNKKSAIPHRRGDNAVRLANFGFVPTREGLCCLWVSLPHPHCSFQIILSVGYEKGPFVSALQSVSSRSEGTEGWQDGIQARTYQLKYLIAFVAV